MPVRRYEIRNEYSLADPDLYRVADKDDPEALLEGVAMAGLVGLLRQLGDLAEFAAEIFHDLHEEVMVTAARGHTLIVRVQQLEAEFPAIERKLLSQTSHTSFLYNSGVDWHSNVRMDQNLVTQGDMPRFVMDSYEECRGPPRLFLLDKFDVAGAGACLKRYTDPSFFKSESATSNGRKSDGHREKRTRRVKKRGPRWKNGDTPEPFLSSHAKLHQLFLEERIESGGNDPDRRVKPKKRQFTGSLFDQDNKKSYMETFLDTCPPDQKVVHEICIDPLPIAWTTDNEFESGLEIVEIGTVSPEKGSRLADRSSYSSPSTKDLVVKPFVEDSVEDKLIEDTRSDDEEMSNGNISTSERSDDISDVESKSEVSVEDGSLTDEAASEIDNYVDALATIDSEVETDSESKVNTRSLDLRPIKMHSDGAERQRESQGSFFESQSVENSNASEDGNYSSKREDNSSCSFSENTTAEMTMNRDGAVMANHSTPVSNSDVDYRSTDYHSVPKEDRENELEAHAMGCTRTVEADDFSQPAEDFTEASSASSLTDLSITYPPFDTKGLQESYLHSPELDEVHSKYAEPETAVSQSFPGPCNGTTIHAPEKTWIEHWSVGESPVNDRGGYDSDHCLKSDLPYTTEEFTGSSKDCEKACSVSSSLEEHTTYPPVKPTNVVHSQGDQYSRSGSSHRLDTQEQFLETTRLDHTHVLDFASGALPSSQEDSKVHKVFTDIDGEALHPTSDGLQNHTPECSVSETAEGADIGSLEGNVASAMSTENETSQEAVSVSADGKTMANCYMAGNSSAVPDGQEPIDQLQDLSSDTAQAGASEQIHGSDDADRLSAPGGGEKYDATHDLDGLEIDHMSSEHKFSRNQTETSWTKTLSNNHGTEAEEVDTTSSSDFRDRQGYENIDHDVAKGETISDASRQFSVDYSQQDTVASLPSSHFEQLKDHPVLVHEGSGQDKVKILTGQAADLATQKPVDPVEGDPLNISSNACNYVSSHPLVDGVEAPLLFVNSSHNVESTSSKQIHLFEGNEGHSKSVHDFAESIVSPLTSIEHTSASAMQQPLNPSFVSSGIDVQATHNLASSAENLGQPVYPPSLPQGVPLAAEPQMKLDPPPLPPLPPIQWRLGKFQSASAGPMRPILRHPPAAAQPMTSTATPTESKNIVSTPEIANHPALLGVSTVSVPPSSSEVSTQCHTVVLGGENDQSLLTPTSTSTSEICSNISQESCHPNVDHPEYVPINAAHACTDNPIGLEEKVDNNVVTQIGQPGHIPQVAAEVISQSDLLPPSTVHYEWQPQPGFVAPEAGMTWSSTYEGTSNFMDENFNGPVQKKAPRPRNPLIVEVVAIDKSKLRKVERVKPPVEPKPDEGESLLEHLQLRKVERVKPSAEPKGEEGEFLREQLQLRKVEDRVKHPDEPKTEEREILLEQLQLKKVGERVKQPVESKTERDSLLEQLQLRKVGERVRPEVEVKPEETESPRVQLRKVAERAPSLVGQKSEGVDSLFEQIRNKSFNLKPAAATRPNIYQARPNIQDSRANLKVAAILEKASNIRQAMAGSDEEDDADNWSDC